MHLSEAKTRELVAAVEAETPGLDPVEVALLVQQRAGGYASVKLVRQIVADMRAREAR